MPKITNITIKDGSPKIYEWLLNKEQGSLTLGSGKRVEVKCPKCGLIKSAKVCDIKRRWDTFKCDNYDCEFCCKQNLSYKYNVGEQVGDLEIINTIRCGNRNIKGYTVKCISEYGHTYDIEEGKLTQRSKCPYCNGQRVDVSNALSTTHPHLIKFLKNKQDGFVVTKGSNKKIDVICPNCGHEKNVYIYNLTSKGFSCPVCGDSISFAEKFISLLLMELDVSFDREVRFDWDNTRRYDFYIKSKNCIIETHGKQHYKDGWIKKSRGLFQEQLNDLLKEIQAKGNGIVHYITLDCSESNIDYIKSSVTNSDLPKVLSFTEQEVDWIKILSKLSMGYPKIMSEMWNAIEHPSVQHIANELKVCEVTVKKYLKVAEKLGWCKCNF